jgi:hypothetical protein
MRSYYRQRGPDGPGWFDNKRQLVDLPPDISIAEAGHLLG